MSGGRNVGATWARKSLHRSATLLLCLIAPTAGGCSGRTAEPVATAGIRPATLFVRVPARTDTANVLLYLPPGYAEGDVWPAVLYLHGGSQRGTDLEKLMSYGPPRMLARGWQPPFILIAPQLPEGEIWTDTEFLVSLIDELSARYRIDRDRVYATGVSMGGRGAWYLAYRHPDHVAAIAPVATYSPIRHWASSGRLRSVPVRAYHGDQDELAPFAEAVAMHDALRAAGGESELRALEGRGHFIADVLEDPDLYEWLLRHRRRIDH